MFRYGFANGLSRVKLSATVSECVFEANMVFKNVNVLVQSDGKTLSSECKELKPEGQELGAACLS